MTEFDRQCNVTALLMRKLLIQMHAEPKHPWWAFWRRKEATIG
ncbi:hypothetical protein [Alicyclobacillus shizuokensis]|nr:hypothetical protein [Alicyclobacillus shizuokensis]